MTDFGPALIGEAEKTLQALLREALAGVLTEPEWVTLRLADRLTGSDADLATTVHDRARFSDAAALVDRLTRRDLLASGRLTPAGRALVTETQARVDALASPVWAGLDPDDVDATRRVLSTVIERARAVLA